MLTGFPVIEPTDDPRSVILEFSDRLLKQFSMFLKDLFWGPLLFNVFINDALHYSGYQRFTDGRAIAQAVSR
jgi:hypothetical protein